MKAPVMTLLEKLQAGDKNSWKYFYKKLFGWASNFITANSGTLADAEDAFQEASIRLWEKISAPDFRLTTKNKDLDPYFKQILRNYWINEHLRKKKHNKTDNVDEDQITNISDSMDEEDIIEKIFNELKCDKTDKYNCIYRTLKKLNDNHQYMIVTYYLDQKSIKEIEAERGYNKGVGRVTLLRAREALKKLLRGDNGCHCLMA